MAAMLCIANVGTPWLSISGAFYLLPYFLCGIFFSRFPFELKQKKIIGFLLMTAIILFLLFYGHEYGGGRRSLNALLIGTLSCTALLFIRGLDFTPIPSTCSMFFLRRHPESFSQKSV